MNNVSFNHIQYADDCVLISPSPTGLQKLLQICQQYALDNDMIYNAKKTVCMLISKRPNKYNMQIPQMFLDGNLLKWTSEHQYLGVLISSDFSDDADIKRQRKSIYAKGNILIRKFRNCTENIKDQLFQSYCSNFYCSSLWSSHAKSTLQSANVAYNNVYRYLHNVKPASMSAAFVSKGINHFKVILRKAYFSLLHRCLNCDNFLVNTIINSAYFLFESKLFKCWLNVLY